MWVRFSCHYLIQTENREFSNRPLVTFIVERSCLNWTCRTLFPFIAVNIANQFKVSWMIRLLSLQIWFLWINIWLAGGAITSYLRYSWRCFKLIQTLVYLFFEIWIYPDRMQNYCYRVHAEENFRNPGVQRLVIERRRGRKRLYLNFSWRRSWNTW